jgi:hypothetical protein
MIRCQVKLQVNDRSGDLSVGVLLGDGRCH